MNKEALDIALEALEAYANPDEWDDDDFRGRLTESCIFHTHGYIIAQEALQKIKNKLET